MGRAKHFDPDQKVDEAVLLFWHRGFEATSVQDLVDTLGVSRGSLYATYGDKDALWLRAVARYCSVRNAELEAALDGPGPLLPRLRTLLESIGAAGSDPPGCLLVNAIAERVRTDEATRELVETQLAHVETALSRALRAAQTGGEIDANASVRRLARFLLATIEGIFVLQRAGADRRTIGDVVDVALAAVR